MPRIIYVNGRYLPRHTAGVACEDRGFLFADGVYEGLELYNGRIVDMERHLERLARSMSEIRLTHPPKAPFLAHVMRECVRRNRYRNGFVYLQITRGEAARDYVFPSSSTPPSIVCMVYNTPPGRYERLATDGISVVTVADIRWKRPDIKSLQLLPGVLAKQTAYEQGAREAWLIDEWGYVTEGASSNAWIVSDEGDLITRQTDRSILGGITRRAVADLIKAEGISLVERPFHKDEITTAQEAFITSSTNTIMPVVRVDETPVGDGRPGTLTRRLRQLYQQRSAQQS